MDPGLVIWMGTGSENPIGCEMGRQMEFPWEIDNWTPTREHGRDFGWEMLNGPRLSDLGEDLVGNFE